MSTPAAQVLPNFKKKLSPSVVAQHRGINLLALERPLKAPIHLYDLFGTVRALKQGVSALGEWTAFTGRFEAVIPETGEVLTSGKAHIPVMGEILAGALDEARVAADGKPVTIEVALRVLLKPAPTDKPSMTGYEYDVQFLVAPRREEEKDPIAQLRKQAAANQARLPAPEPAPAEEKKSGKK